MDDRNDHNNHPVLQGCSISFLGNSERALLNTRASLYAGVPLQKSEANTQSKGKNRWSYNIMNHEPASFGSERHTSLGALHSFMNHGPLCDGRHAM